MIEGAGQMTNDVHVALQIGSPMDGSDGLIWSLRKNAPLLDARDCVVPRPKFYRRPLTRLAETLRGNPAPVEAQDTLLYAGLESNAGRIFFASTEQIGSADTAFDDGVFFGAAGDMPSWTRALFPQAAFSFFMGLSNPAMMIAELVHSGAYGTYEEITDGAALTSLKWSDVIARIRAKNPDVPLILWTKEEIPFVWPRIMRAVLGDGDATELEGALDPLGAILTPEGHTRLETYLADHPGLNEDARIRVLEIFMEKFARPDQIAVDIDLPGWKNGTYEAMTETYETDLEVIAAMEGVTLISA
ncbi:hypothetical protein DI396_08815 [Litorivita pollutaquae]|uniref:Uncharacterized protein n=2 Tax=Litorivita pollutaquae TaxID=2200892 RepID=A0A2V4MLJ8_9RHOB|nr:hypothetical protein DI396_08815 [Litorivita pollutaquae]